MSDVPGGFTQQNWNDFVEKGRALVKRESDQAWAWGDLANEYAPANDTTANTGHVLETWAEAIGYEGEVATLRARRQVSSAWPLDIRISSASWRVHQVLAPLEDRARVIRSRDRWTVSAARAFLEKRREDEKLEVETRLEAMSIASDIRQATIAHGRRLDDLLTKLRAPLPEHGTASREALREQLTAARDGIDLLIGRVDGAGESVEDALAKLLTGGA